MPTRLQIIQRAQARIGDEPITSETDPGADTHIAIFDAVTADLIARYPWSFATTIGPLTAAAAPAASWQHAFTLPSDIDGSPLAVYNQSAALVPFQAYELVSGQLLTNASAIWLHYTRQPDPSLWPGDFAQLVMTLIMAEMHLSIREDTEGWQRFQAIVFGAPELRGQGGTFAQVRARDAMGNPWPSVKDMVVEQLLSSYPWTFGMTTTQLSLASGAPPLKWAHYYQLPADMIGAPRAFYTDATFRLPVTDLEVAEGRVATNATAIWMRYTRRADAAIWPGYFAALVDVAVRAEMAMQALSNVSMWAQLHEQAFGPPSFGGMGGLYGKATSADVQGKPSPVIAEGVNPLIDVRFGSAPRQFIG